MLVTDFFNTIGAKKKQLDSLADSPE